MPQDFAATTTPPTADTAARSLWASNPFRSTNGTPGGALASVQTRPPTNPSTSVSPIARVHGEAWLGSPATYAGQPMVAREPEPTVVVALPTSRSESIATGIHPFDIPTASNAGCLIEVAPIRLAVLTSGRNAWHSTWVNRYMKNAVMYPNIRAAKRAAEKRRKSGTVLYIAEVPALVFRAVGGTAVLTDIHPENPFGGWRPFPRGGPILGPGSSSLLAVRSAFHDTQCWVGPQRNRDSLLMGLVTSADGLEDLNHRRPLLWLRSSPPAGRGSSLEWTHLGRRYTRRGANAATRRFGALVQEEPA